MFADWSQPFKLQDAAVATGDGQVWAVNNRGAVCVSVEGITTATITWEISNDRTNFYGIPALNLTSKAFSLTATANGLYYLALPGVVFLRARISSYTTGTITASAIAVPMTGAPNFADVTIETGDLQIGAVEIKNSTDDTRATVGANGLHVDIRALPNEGQQTMANSISVAVASDQSAVPVSGTVTSTPAVGAAAGMSLVHSAAYEASRVLKASAGTLISLVGYNSRTSAQFIQLFNSATVPADTAVPDYTFTVPASSNFSLDVPISGIPFTTGIAVANSSTGPTKTVGSADCYFSAVIK